MKILFVNTSQSVGGAAIAANRIMIALHKQHIQTRMLVLHRTNCSAYIEEQPHILPFLKAFSDRLRFVADRLVVFLANKLHRQHLFDVDAAAAGYDITKSLSFKNADIIHLHWVNQGFMSLRSLEKLAKSGKPVVWTLHDMWPLTGICHHAQNCTYFHDRCHSCHYLHGKYTTNDLSTSVFLRKQKLLAKVPQWHFVTVSEWLRREVAQSALLQGQTITTIHNPLDTTTYFCFNKQGARRFLHLPQDKIVFLFVAYRVTDVNKGYHHLIKSLKELLELDPSLKERAVVAAAGREAEQLRSHTEFPVYDMGYITNPDVMIQLYNAADLLLMPSLQDTLPNTIAEAMACETPCVAFSIGGIPEMIDHKENGYLAEEFNTSDFAQGIIWCLQNNAHESLNKKAREKALETYSEKVVAEKYLKVYREVLETGIEPVQPLLAKGF